MTQVLDYSHTIFINESSFLENFIMSENNSNDVNGLLLKFMIIGDFIAIFTIFAALLFTFHFILVKINPSLCYHNAMPNEKFDISKMATGYLWRFFSPEK